VRGRQHRSATFFTQPTNLEKCAKTSNRYLISIRPPRLMRLGQRPFSSYAKSVASSPLESERRRLRHRGGASCGSRHAPSFSTRNQRTAQESRNISGKGKSSRRSKIWRPALFALANPAGLAHYRPREQRSTMFSKRLFFCAAV
jgi:hypothetical protein